MLAINSFKDRCCDISVMFVFDVLSNRINSPYIMSMLDFNEPSVALELVHYSVLSMVEPIMLALSRLCREFNAVSYLFDVACYTYKFTLAELDG